MANHFTDDSWSDYVRNVLPDPDAAAMSQHLDEGCEICRGSYRLWQAVAETARSEVRNQVPEDVLRMSTAAYRAWRQSHLAPQRARMARLIFDSLLAPLPTGVRSESSGQRRMLGRVGQWTIDLLFEPSAGKRMFLMGQIGSGQRHVVPAGLLILLMSTDALLAKTEANQFGEFHLQFVQANGLRLYVDIPGKRPIGISLPDLDKPPAAADPAPD